MVQELLKKPVVARQLALLHIVNERARATEEEAVDTACVAALLHIGYVLSGKKLDEYDIPQMYQRKNFSTLEFQECRDVVDEKFDEELLEHHVGGTNLYCKLTPLGQALVQAVDTHSDNPEVFDAQCQDFIKKAYGELKAAIKDIINEDRITLENYVSMALR